MKSNYEISLTYFLPWMKTFGYLIPKLEYFYSSEFQKYKIIAWLNNKKSTFHPRKGGP